MKKLLLLLFILIGFSCQAQEVSGADYLDDFNIIIRSLQELHPKLYTNISKDDFDTQVAEISQRLLVTSSRSKAIYMIQELFYKLGNSHAGNISVFDDLGVQKTLPFSVYIIDHNLYIKNYARDSSLNGLKINAIEHTPSTKLIDSLKIFFATDGNVPVISNNLQPLFNNIYGFFSYQKDSFLIDTEKGPIKMAAALKGDSIYEALIHNHSEAYFGKDRFLKKIITADYGYIKFAGFVPTFKGYEIEKEYNAFIKEANEKQLKAIVIDLRNNSGGDPYLAGRMTAQLIDHPFRVFEKLYITPVGVPTYIKWMENKKAFRIRHLKANDIGDMNEIIHYEKGLKITEPSPERYKGKIYVITGSITQSSSTMMCKYLMGQPNVTFVGSPTIGAINYFWAGSHCSMKLTNLNTKFSFGLELIELKKGSNAKEKPENLVPEHLINYNIQERLQNRDKEMEFILEDLKK